MFRLRRLIAAVSLCLFVISWVPGRASAQEAAGAAPQSSPAEAGTARVIGRGTHTMDAGSLQSVGDLTVRRGATAIIDVANVSDLVLSGNLTNRGRIYFGSSAG